MAVIACNTRHIMKGKMTGIGHFTFEVLDAMSIAHPDDTFVYIYDRPFNPDFTNRDNIKPIWIPPPARSPLLFKLWYDWAIPKALQKIKADIFFSPDHFCSLNTSVPTYLVVHDLGFMHYPEMIPKNQVGYYHKFFPKFIQKAKKIGTVSNFTKQDLLNTFPLDSSKVDVIGNGLNTDIKYTNDKELINQTKTKFGIKSNFFIHIGTLQPRKNICTLLRSFDQFRSNTRDRVQLILIGDKGWQNSEIHQVFNTMEHKNDVILAGYIENSEISALLSSAIALVNVSLFEGFGLPIIEAQACHCPVICSNTSALVEVSGDAALLVSPLEVQEIAHAMHLMQNDPILRDQMSIKGLENIKNYSWNLTAERIYRSFEMM